MILGLRFFTHRMEIVVIVIVRIERENISIWISILKFLCENIVLFFNIFLKIIILIGE